MTGIPTQFTIADLVVDELTASGGAVPSNADLPFYDLGAMAPQLADFLPALVENGTAEPNSRLLGVWLPILQLLAGDTATPGMYPTLKTLRDTLERFRTVTHEEDKFALLGMVDDLNALTGLITTLQQQIQQIDGIRASVATAVVASRPLPKVQPTRDWRQRDTVHGSLTGRFLAELRTRAEASGDSRLVAFAAGASVAYAGTVTGNPFINGAVGGPYRSHWWRHRWVSNYVDSWVWGYYRTRPRVRANQQEIVFSNGGRVPVPPYAVWDNACGADLQRRVAIGGITVDAVFAAIRDNTALPAFLPSEVVSLWLDSYRAVYGTAGPGGPPNGVDEGGLQSAYALSWLTLWISTSPEFLSCTPADQINYPDNCGARPDWVEVDGSVVVGGRLVPPPNIGQPMDPSVTEIISGILVALLAVAAFWTGNIGAGIALILAAVALIVDGATEPDWEKLRCHAEWVSVFIAKLENQFRDLLQLVGLGIPYTVQLAHNEIFFQTFGDVVPPTAALVNCRSPFAGETGYPRALWEPTNNLNQPKNNWNDYPTEGPEMPGTRSYPGRSNWPLHFVDGFSFVDNGSSAVPRYPGTQNNPISMRSGTPTVLSRDEWDERRGQILLGGSPEALFGNALEVALALLRASPDELLDWDLDGDRGMGFPTWFLASATTPPGAVTPE
jgi:AcrR family transcriptional regulator